MFLILLALSFSGVADTVSARRHRTVHAAFGERRASFPNLDMEAGCKDVSNNALNKTVDYKGCMNEERAAREELKKEWASYSASMHDQCMHLVTPPALPSYITLQECLKMSSDAQKMAKSGGVSQLGKTMESPSRN
jgi:hypothetical protein